MSEAWPDAPPEGSVRVSVHAGVRGKCGRTVDHDARVWEGVPLALLACAGVSAGEMRREAEADRLRGGASPWNMPGRRNTYVLARRHTT
jgi:hypothetical protein